MPLLPIRGVQVADAVATPSGALDRSSPGRRNRAGSSGTPLLAPTRSSRYRVLAQVKPAVKFRSRRAEKAASISTPDERTPGLTLPGAQAPVAADVSWSVRP